VGARPQVSSPPSDDAAIPPLVGQYNALGGVVDRLGAHDADLKTQASQSTLIANGEKELRSDVLAELRSLSAVARALRATIPGIGVLKMVDSQSESEPLVRAATSFSAQAVIYQSILVEHGQPHDCIKRLDDATQRLRQSIDARGEARSRRAGAAQGIREELALGRRIVMILDASMTRMLRTQPVALAEWRHVKRVTLRGATSRTVVADITPSVTPSTQAA